MDCLDKEVFLDLTEPREDVETSVPLDQREVQEKWEREDNRALLVPHDLQDLLPSYHSYEDEEGEGLGTLWVEDRILQELHYVQ